MLLGCIVIATLLACQLIKIKRQRSICIPLSKINAVASDYYAGFDLNISTAPIRFKGYSIWPLQDIVNWYAIECDGSYYAFSLFELVNLIQKYTNSSGEYSVIDDISESLSELLRYVDVDTSVSLAIKPTRTY